MTYISFWPVGGAGKKDVTKKVSHAPEWVPNLPTDVEMEGNCQPQTIRISGLDESAMIAEFNAIVAEERRYNLLRCNCATIVARLLETGSGRRPSFVPEVRIADWVANPRVRLGLTTLLMRQAIRAWTPEAILRYANELRSTGSVRR